MLVFAPELFTECQALEDVSRAIENSGKERLDFNLEPIPQNWTTLREQAQGVFKNLPVYSADLRPLARRL